MKAVFLILVLANACLLGWGLMGREPKAPQPKAIPVVGEPLVLLSELSPNQLADAVEQKQRIQMKAPVEPGLAAESKRLCTLIGPFEKILQAEYAVENLAAREVEATLERLEIAGDPGFWVYLTPLASRKEALRKLHELQAKGIDSYVIPKGDLVNGISFGMYSQRGSAATRKIEVERLGYAANIQEVPRSYEELWVMLQPEQAAKLDSAAWQKFINERKGLERRENYCPGVASL
ncbi:MAG: SPOR domain-containing protein [Cellvibrionaceae bacterium]|nr:SPOR domain-containing protein [Cellvibrionaceae bacterium]